MKTGFHRICARHRKARQPFDAICVIACSTIAVGSGISISSTPIRIMPPAMPNRPDRKAVATIKAPRAAIMRGVKKSLLYQRGSDWRGRGPVLLLRVLHGEKVGMRALSANSLTVGLAERAPHPALRTDLTPRKAGRD